MYKLKIKKEKVKKENTKWFLSLFLPFNFSFYLVFPFFTFSFLLLPSSASAASLSKPSNNLGLAGYWSFDEDAGTVAHDGSGGGNSGTLTNGPTWVVGKFGKALNFDGVDDYIITTAKVNLATNFTWSAWVNISSMSSTNQMFGQGNGQTNGFYFNIDANGAATGFGGSNVLISSNGTITAGSWYHITITKSGTAGTLYINGVSAATGTFGAGINDSTSNFEIGRVYYSGSYYGMPNKKIDEVRVYNRALSATEVGGLYNKDATKFKGVSNKGLVGYWSLDEGTSTIAHDQSGNGNNGTLTNMATPPTATSGWGNGKLSKGLNFDGSNDYTSLPNLGASVSGAGARTVSAWIYPTSNSGAMAIYSSGIVSTANLYEVVFNQTAANNIYIPTVGGDVYTGANTITLNAWNHVIVTYSGGNVFTNSNIYINGVLQSLNTAGSAYTLSTNNSNYTIGSRGGSSEFFAGKIDDVHVYSRVLSATEAATLYNQGSTKFQSKTENTVAQDSLAGYWSFNGKDMNGTTAYDRSGNNNNGTLTNGPTKVAGKLGQGLRFDGNNDRVLTSSLNNGTAGTWSAWIKANSFGNDGIYSRRILQQSDGSGNHEINLLVNSSGVINWYGYGGSYVWNISGGSLTAGQWYHVAGVYDGSNSYLYTNGQLVSTSAQTGPVGSATYGLTIGAVGYNDIGHFNGLIDEVRIYSKALTATEVKQLYLQGK